jgi:hypothetical protein
MSSEIESDDGFGPGELDQDLDVSNIDTQHEFNTDESLLHLSDSIGSWSYIDSVNSSRKHDNSQAPMDVAPSSSTYVDQDLSHAWTSYSTECIRSLENQRMLRSLDSTFNHPCTVHFDSWFAHRLPSPLDAFVSSAVYPTNYSISDRPKTTLKRQSESSAVNYPDTVWKNVAQRISNVPWSEQLDISRTAALNKWRKIIQIDPKSSSFGRTLLAEVLQLKNDHQLNRSLEDALSGKSTKTLHKRADYLVKYISWCSFKAVSPFPIEEKLVYSFLYDCSWQAASFGSAFRESLNFAGGVLGFDGAISSASSQRIVGYCSRKLIEKKKRIQAKPLSVKQVVSLEHLVSKAPDRIDRMLAGHMLFVLYSRARWSDAQAVEAILDDTCHDGTGFIECHTYYVKTANNTDKKRMFLPLTAVSNGLNNAHWVRDWLLARAEVGLNQPTKGVPLLPSIKHDGKFSNQPMTPSLGSKCLRDLLLLGGATKEEIRNISSHSLKTTCLSWCAKAGLLREHRQILGYHIVSGSLSALRYSRDEQAEPLRQLANILTCIRNKQFNPDCSRSGYWTTKASILLPKPKSRPSSIASEPAASVEEPVEHALSSSSSSTSSVSSNSGKWSEEERAFSKSQSLETDAKRRRGASASSTSGYALHTRWRTLHFVNKSDESKTACGRVLTTLFKRLQERPSFDHFKCQVCYGDSV